MYMEIHEDFLGPQRSEWAASGVFRGVLKTLLKIQFLAAIFLAGFCRFVHAGSVGVAAFAVNGPKDLQYLSGAAQDAVIGALVKQGAAAHPVTRTLDPDKLKSISQGKGQDDLLVAGRINIVGQTYRVLLKWVGSGGQVGQEYLEVGDVNQLLPRLESFAASRLQATAQPRQITSNIFIEEPAALPSQGKKKAAKTPEIETSSIPPAPEQKAKPAISQKSRIPSAKPSSKVEVAGTFQDYSSVSQRLPYEVRALAYGDVDGDGASEVLLTDSSELYLYRQQDGALQEAARYSGKNLDHFVKVDLMPAPDGGRPWIVLTNLRGRQAASQILRFQNGQFSPVIENIDYQLRVIGEGTHAKLLGQPYRGDAGNYAIYEMKVSGNKVEVGEKLPLPKEVGLYNFDYLPAQQGGGFALAGLTSSGKMKLFKDEAGKYKGAWTSRESYGGSANDIGVKVKNFFNEVVGDYYIVPLRVQAVHSDSNPELLVAKNDALLKDIVGRKPVISDGRMVLLKWNPLGMEEVWSSKKVDGSILDYLVTGAPEERKLLVAVRMRDQGFWEGIGRKDSVLLVYDLK
ncbi:MAG TPA: hypothetical protein DF383_02655 [Deltaproteobacteria bacterium]|nr:hypothetical protein [Deltaproteobacteria bacterium]